MFGFSSTLIPAGYNNDEYFYQCPNQQLWGDIKPTQDSYKYRANNSIMPSPTTSPQVQASVLEPISSEHIELTEITIKHNVVANTTVSSGHLTYSPVKMKSGLFLVLHTVTSTLLLSGCAIYISVTRDNLSDASSNALILPQTLAVIPGCFFTLSRSVLFLTGSKPNICPGRAWNVVLVIFSSVLAIIAYGSVIPALFWSLLWKVSGAAVDLIKEIDDAT